MPGTEAAPWIIRRPATACGRSGPPVSAEAQAVSRAGARVSPRLRPPQIGGDRPRACASPGRAAEIAGARSRVVERTLDRGADIRGHAGKHIRVIFPRQPIEHHRAAEDRRDGVGFVLARDRRRRPMRGLEHSMAVADVAGWRETEAADEFRPRDRTRCRRTCSPPRRHGSRSAASPSARKTRRHRPVASPRVRNRPSPARRNATGRRRSCEERSPCQRR